MYIWQNTKCEISYVLLYEIHIRYCTYTYSVVYVTRNQTYILLGFVLVHYGIFTRHVCTCTCRIIHTENIIFSCNSLLQNITYHTSMSRSAYYMFSFCCSRVVSMQAGLRAVHDLGPEIRRAISGNLEEDDFPTRDVEEPMHRVNILLRKAVCDFSNYPHLCAGNLYAWVLRVQRQTFLNLHL